jgi:hypothetical protein
LQDLPRALWRAPLDDYARLSLAEIRALKAHGDKRVGAVVAIFGNLNRILAGVEASPHLAARIVPKFVSRIESWYAEAATSAVAPGRAVGRAWFATEIRESWIMPILEQLAVDAGESVVRMVEYRLHPNSISVLRMARHLGMTRSRIYETLADVETILSVRWPEGRAFASALRSRLADKDASALVDSAMQVFYPVRSQPDAPLPLTGRSSNGLTSGRPRLPTMFEPAESAALTLV